MERIIANPSEDILGVRVYENVLGNSKTKLRMRCLQERQGPKKSRFVELKPMYGEL